MIFRFRKLCFLFVTSIVINLQSYDNPHFYRATHIFDEPRLSNPLLTSLDISFYGGKTHDGFNSCNNSRNILQIYGLDDLTVAVKDVPEYVINKAPNSILNNLWTKNIKNNFGKIEFSGKFSIMEATFSFYQNFCKGTFFHLYIPIRSFNISKVCINDLSEQNESSVSFKDWKEFAENLNSNLSAYDLSISPIKKSGFGDLTLLLGWTMNYEDTCYLDFIDATFQAGVLLPTGKKKNINKVFDLPTGYNDHFAIPVLFDTSLGLYEWITFGVHAQGIFFFNKKQQLRMKTDINQSGFIKLTKGFANVHQGNIWDLGLYLKADHLNNAWSLFFAYQFSKQEKTKLTPYNTDIFSCEIVNTDEQLQSWYMNVINIEVEYDFENFNTPNMPQVKFYLDIPVSGKRIFKTIMIGGGIGINYDW